jgi:hypothetical protein
MRPNPAASPAGIVAAPPKVRRQRLGIRLSQHLRRRLHQYAVAKGRKESAIIEELVADHLASGGGRHTESSPPSPIDRLVAAINEDRTARAADLREVLRSIDLLSEAFGRFVGFWMTTATPLPMDESKRAAIAKASAANYESFARMVGAHFARGHRFVHDVLQALQAKSSGAPGAGSGASSPHGGGKA